MASLDEAKAVRLLEEHGKVLRREFGKFNGRVVKTMGDGFLIEFPSAVDAVNCAVEAQQAMGKLNVGRTRDEKVVIRIGIHVGDVIHSDGDLMGDAVNVAARLEPMADPGGVCVSRQVVDQVERKVSWKMVKLGTRELKNIRYPVELYKVETDAKANEQGESSLDPRRIAILPFANLSADPNDRYFADGMTEELISTVSNIGELSVISRTSVMRYKDTTAPIGEIGRELSVGTVLEGSVRKAGNKVRVTTQLIDAQNDRHLWAQSYDRDITDIFAIQGDIAGQVAEALRVRLLSKEKDAIGKKATDNLDAYTLYLKGRHFWNERSKESLSKAIDFFKKAVAIDPDFALAYSGLADSYLILEDRTLLSYDDAIPVAKGYAERAVELDESLAEAHASLGLVLEKQWEMAGAERELKKALALKPNYATANHWYSLLLSQLGKPGEGYEFEMRALSLDPQSSTVRQGVGVMLLYLGRHQEAMSQFDAVLELDPDFGSAYFWKAWTYYEMGNINLAIAAARKASGMAGGAATPKSALAWLYLRSGQREPAMKLLEEMMSTREYRPATLIAIVKFGMGDIDEGFEWLQEAFRQHDGFLIYFREFPWFAEYRADPRWDEIQRKMGLPKI